MFNPLKRLGALNPVKKLASFLGITKVQGRNIQLDPTWIAGQRGTAGGSKSPLHLRVESRRRKNKAARKARRHTRS